MHRNAAAARRRISAHVFALEPTFQCSVCFQQCSSNGAPSRARLEAVRKAGDYFRAFRSMLEDVAADALVPLYGQGHAGLIFTAVYSPAEIVSGSWATEQAGLSVEEGVTCFVMLGAACEAELQKRGGLLQRLTAKLPPRQGTRADVHLALFNYMRENPPGGHIPSPEAFDLFARRYSENLAQNEKT